MTNDTIQTFDEIVASLIASSGSSEELHAEGYYFVECVGPDGQVKWRDIAKNVVTTQGRNSMMDVYLDRSAALAAIAMGLHTTVGTATSTYATPTPQVESTAYSNANRPTPTFSASSGGAKSTSAAVAFNINGTATITGCFIAIGASGVATKGDTAASAVLFSSGSFTGGSRSVLNGDTLNVSYTLTLT